jgi:hypothetical protein
MGKHPYLVLSLIPVLVWIIIIILNPSQGSSDAFEMSEAQGMVMGEGNEQLTVFIDRLNDGEIGTDIISLRSTDGSTAFEDKISIDYDMFGKGLITAIQIDDDPELELLAWGNNVIEGESFYLDYVEGVVEKISFDNVPGEIKDHIINGKGQSDGLIIIAGLMVILTPIYYLILVITFFSRRSRNK